MEVEGVKKGREKERECRKEGGGEGEEDYNIVLFWSVAIKATWRSSPYIYVQNQQQPPQL